MATTAIDSSVLLDLLLASPNAEASGLAMVEAAKSGTLVVSECVVAEISPSLGQADLPQFLSDWWIVFVPSSLRCASLAGEMFTAYLERGGRRGRVVADFMIAAHAQVHADRLLTRDLGFDRDYFHGLSVIRP